MNYTRTRVASSALRLLIVVVLIMGAIPLVISSTPSVSAQASLSGLLISEYIEGSSNNKAVEIYNGTGSDINLTDGNYVLAIYFNGKTTSTKSVTLSGTLSAGGTYVLADAKISTTTISGPIDQTIPTGTWNGNDAIVLWYNGIDGTVVDSFGQVGYDPGTQWSSGGVSTLNHTLIRKAGVCSGDTTINDAFDPSVEWDQYAQDYSELGSHTSSCSTSDAPSVSSTTPSADETAVAIDSDVVITFSEDVTVTGDWFAIACASSGTFTPSNSNVSVSGGPQEYTISPTGGFGHDEDCDVTVYAAQVTDDTPNTMDADHTFSFHTAIDYCALTGWTTISAIQGSGSSSSTASNVMTRGIVTGDFQGDDSLGGFFIQAAASDSDGDPATSEGLFVYQNKFTKSVDVGDEVVVIGDVSEYYSLTEISVKGSESAHVIQVCSTGNTVTPTAVDLPIPDTYTDSEDFWERYEGMYVTIAEDLMVTDVYELGRYGNVTLTVGDRLEIFTQKNLPSVTGYQDHLDNLFRTLVFLNDSSNDENPDTVIFPSPGLARDNDLRAGSTTTQVAGIVNYSYYEYRIEPVVPVVFNMSANPRPTSTPPVGGTLKVASFNLLNFFTTIDTGSYICGPSASLECRGADTTEEYTRQLAKTVAALAALDADVVGMAEMENHASDTALITLVNELNAVAGAGTYAPILTGPIGTDAIKVAIIYKTSTVTPVGSYQLYEFTGDAAENYRPSLAQTFEEISTGETFTMVMNHFKSKGCSDDLTGADADQSDGQSCYNYTRTEGAKQLAAWLDTDPTGSGDTDFLVMGDLNSYAQEDPLFALEAGGLEDQIEKYVGYLDSAYSYSYDGEYGTLDYAFATSSLADQITAASEWHINSDETPAFDYNNYNQASLYGADQYRISDHDPIIVGLELVTATESSSSATGTSAYSAASAVDANGNPITSLPSTGYAPQSAARHTVSAWLIGALLVMGLMLGGWTLRRSLLGKTRQG